MGTPYYVDEIPNYSRFHQRLREVLESDEHEVVGWELLAPRDGFRFVRVYMKGGPTVTWNQEWEGEFL
jgi:hypothetical protein